MTRWYSEIPEYSKISLEEKLLRDKIIAIMDKYTQEMEGYSYYGSNPGIEKDSYEDVADELLLAFIIQEREKNEHCKIATFP